MHVSNRILGWSVALLLAILYFFSTPSNHSEAEDVYDFALRVEQGCFAEQAGVNRVLALPVFGAMYHIAQAVGYSGRAFPFMIFVNRLVAMICLFLFYRLLACCEQFYHGASTAKLSIFRVQFKATLCLAFSYGFWRYANEAETYILASVFVVGTWYLVLNQTVSDKKSFVFWNQIAIAVGSAVGILVHLLNVIPLLFIVPLYYLLSREWKKALWHGGLTGVLVVVGYGICFRALDLSELGAQHHAMEGGIGFSNLLRAGIAFGQCLISGNFLFGFETFRGQLVGLFPSRVLVEEFFMATKMGEWIPWTGLVTLFTVAISGLWIGMNTICHRKIRSSKFLNYNPLFISVLVWFVLYAVAVMRTEAGSPELWIMALIPFWLLFVPMLRQRSGWVFVFALFAHNLTAGLLPIMSERSDYHAQKAQWLVGNTTKNDVILTSYEPVMIFYLNYYVPALVMNSGDKNLNEIEQMLGNTSGSVYALGSFFDPLDSMKIRYPILYDGMVRRGQSLLPQFKKVVDNEFGGIYALRQTEDRNE